MENFKITRLEYGRGSKRAFLIFPHWGSNLFIYKMFVKLFPRTYRVLYHYSPSLLTADIPRTIERFGFLEKTVRNDFISFKKEGIDSLCFYGSSLGSILATRLANIAKAEGFKVSLVLNLSSASFPYAVWNGKATRHIQKELAAKGVTFEELNKAWSYLSPVNNLKNLRRAPILLFASSRDDIFGRSNVAELIMELKKSHPNATCSLTRLGHTLGGIKGFFGRSVIKPFLLR
ncbi:MAG: hypothetical protein Q8R12_04525 [bacterium]|nr:hypothetical protein [bacterium]